MEWNVYYYNSNARKIHTYNALAYREKAIAKLRKAARSKEEFAEGLRKEMQYHYWSKFEWEITIKSYGDMTRDGSEAVRVDVYDQLRLNWDRFVDYCWTCEIA